MCLHEVWIQSQSFPNGDENLSTLHTRRSTDQNTTQFGVCFCQPKVCWRKCWILRDSLFEVPNALLNAGSVRAVIQRESAFQIAIVGIRQDCVRCREALLFFPR